MPEKAQRLLVPADVHAGRVRFGRMVHMVFTLSTGSTAGYEDGGAKGARPRHREHRSPLSVKGGGEREEKTA